MNFLFFHTGEKETEETPQDIDVILDDEAYQALCETLRLDFLATIGIDTTDQTEIKFVGPAILTECRANLRKQEKHLSKKFKFCCYMIESGRLSGTKLAEAQAQKQMYIEQKTKLKTAIRYLTRLLKAKVPALPYLRGHDAFIPSDKVFYWLKSRENTISFQPGEVIRANNGLVTISLNLDRQRIICSQHDAKLLSHHDYNYLFDHLEDRAKWCEIVERTQAINEQYLRIMGS